MYTGRLFHLYMLDESICHLKGAGSILSLFIYFLWRILLANTVDPDQTPHHDLGQYFAYDPLTGFQVRMVYRTYSEMGFCAVLELLRHWLSAKQY